MNKQIFHLALIMVSMLFLTIQGSSCASSTPKELEDWYLVLSDNDESYTADRVIAMVNSKPILLSQVVDRYDKLKKAKKISKKERKSAKYKIIDEFINEELLMQAADRESIIVSDEKIDNHIEKNLMPFYKIKTIEAFQKRIERTEKIPYDMYREQIRVQLIMEQIMVYAMDFVPPTEGMAKEWYEENKTKLLQVKFQHIVIRPKDDSFQSEKEANLKIEELKEKALSGESFGKLARQYSQDRESSRNNGYIDWIGFGELDPKLAYFVYQMKEKNSISNIFKTDAGYHIVKYHGRRHMPYDEIRDRIFQILSQQARQEQFDDWVKRERHVSDVRVLIDDYYEYTKRQKDRAKKIQYSSMKNHERQAKNKIPETQNGQR